MILVVNSAGVTSPGQLEFDSTCPPYGPSVLVAFLRQAGIDAMQADLRNKVTPRLSRPLEDQDFEQWLERGEKTHAMEEFLALSFDSLSALPRSKLVAISVLSYASRSYALSLAKAIKDSFPHIVVCLGGPYVTIKGARPWPHVDYVVRGAGQELLLSLARRVIEGTTHDRNASGLAYPDCDGWADNGIRQESPEAEAAPDFSDLDLNDYVHRGNRELFWHETYERVLLPYRTSVGCPGKCSFCTGRLVGRLGFKSEEKVVSELTRLRSSAVRTDVLFCDSAINSHPDLSQRIFDGIRKRGLDLGWYAYLRAKGVNPPLLRTYAESGCRGLFWGLEALDPRMMDVYGKRFDLAQAEENISLSSQLGVKNVIAVLYNGPREPEDHFDRIERLFSRFADEERVYFQFYPLVLERGSTMHEHPARYGMEILDDPETPSYLDRELVRWKEAGVDGKSMLRRHVTAARNPSRHEPGNVSRRYGA